MKTLLLLCFAIVLPGQTYAAFWDRPEFVEADNVADLQTEAIKERRQEKYKIIQYDLYLEILRAYDESTLQEGPKSEVEFAALKRAPMYTSTYNENGAGPITARPVAVYIKFADDFSRVCLRRKYNAIISYPLETRCLSLRPGADSE